MPITRSAKKALRQSLRRRTRNLTQKLAAKALIKEVKMLAQEHKQTEALSLLAKAYKAVDKAAKTGVLTDRAAARKKSRLTRLLKKQEGRS